MTNDRAVGQFLEMGIPLMDGIAGDSQTIADIRWAALKVSQALRRFQLEMDVARYTQSSNVRHG